MHLYDSRTFIKLFNDMDNIYKNIEERNLKKPENINYF